MCLKKWAECDILVKIFIRRKEEMMSKDKTSIVFTGDIGFDRYMDRKWEDPELLSREVMDFFHSAEHVCAKLSGGNVFECTEH